MNLKHWTALWTTLWTLSGAEPPPTPSAPATVSFVSEGTTFRLTGDEGNEHERRPFALVFDSGGRFRADYASGPFVDAAFDGRRVLERDPAGRVLESSGWARDASLLVHGLLCGNWRGDGTGWRTTTVADDGATLRLRLQPGERPFEAFLTVDPRTHRPLQVSFNVLGREQSLAFEDWRESAAGAFPGRVRYAVDGAPFGEYRFERLERVTAAGDPFGLEPGDAADAEFLVDVDDELELQVAPSGHAFVRVSVDGGEPGWFLFDSGATNSVLDEAAARGTSFSVLVDGGSASGATGAAAFRMGRIEELRVGPLAIRSLVVATADLSGLDQVFGLELAGILGADVLVHATWLYDLSAPRVAVVRPERVGELDPTWLPAARNEGHLLVPAGFEGHQGRFILDTAGGSVPVTLNHPTLSRLDLLRDRPTRLTGVTGLGGAGSMRRGDVDRFVFAGQEHGRVGALFGADEGVWSDPYVDGLIGIWVLRRGTAILDYPRDRVGFVPHETAAPTDGGRRR